MSQSRATSPTWALAWAPASAPAWAPADQHGGAGGGAAAPEFGPAMTPEEALARYEAGSELRAFPFSHAVGMRVIETGEGLAVLAIPYDPRLVGDPDTGAIHGGVVTALLDSCAGAAVFASPTRPRSTATLDLRIDYMRPSTPDVPLFAKARCYRETQLITFVRAVAFHTDPADPVATAHGAFTVEDRAQSPHRSDKGAS